MRKLIMVLESQGLSVNKGPYFMTINAQGSSLFAKLPPQETEMLLSYFKKGVIALDLEMTGLSPLVDRVVEVSAVKLNPNGELETFSRLVNPEMPMPKVAESIHGISDDMVKEKSTFNEVLPLFLNFCGNMPLLAHNAKFDIGFLVYAMHETKTPLPDSLVYCSCQWSRSCLKDTSSHKLSSLAKYLDIPIENHHRALHDAYACLRVLSKGLIRLSSKLEKKGLEFNTTLIEKGRLLRLSDFQIESKTSLDIPPHLSLLANIIHAQTIIDIKYKGGSFKNQFRPVRPISLLPMPSGNVLYALCLKTNIYKFFTLKKIKEVKSLNAEDIQLRLNDYESQLKPVAKKV